MVWNSGSLATITNQLPALTLPPQVKYGIEVRPDCGPRYSPAGRYARVHDVWQGYPANVNAI